MGSHEELGGNGGTAMKRLAYYVAVAVVLIVGLAALSGCRSDQANAQLPQTQPMPAAGPAVGKPAPDFTLNTFDGQTISLSSLKGKPVAVIFWSSTCHYCAQEAPILEQLYQQYKGQGLEVLGVGLDDEAALRDKAKQLKLTYPNGYNPQAGQRYGIDGVPHTFIVDREGTISASLLGARPKDQLEEEIKKVL
jgi:cytochrome c biogenesis protein CcmG, thiol:disulfide interchange protein DsbE